MHICFSRKCIHITHHESANNGYPYGFPVFQSLQSLAGRHINSSVLFGCWQGLIKRTEVFVLDSVALNLNLTTHQLCDLGQMTWSHWVWVSLSYEINTCLPEVLWRLNGVKHIKCPWQYLDLTNCIITVNPTAKSLEILRANSSLSEGGWIKWSLSNCPTLRFCDPRVTKHTEK